MSAQGQGNGQMPLQGMPQGQPQMGQPQMGQHPGMPPQMGQMPPRQAMGGPLPPTGMPPPMSDPQSAGGFFAPQHGMQHGMNGMAEYLARMRGQ